MVDCLNYEKELLVERYYSLSKPIDTTFIKRYEDTLDEKLELEATDQHIFYS
jgi:hypothetical protein